jgi:hypothetical protein
MEGTKPVNENIFWEVVSDLGWDRVGDYKGIKRKLMERFTWEQIEALAAIDTAVYRRLYKAVTDWEEKTRQSCGCSDDGFSDLLNHIVGLGREEWQACLDDPSKAKARADRGDYTESFSYCWPRHEDYKQLTLKGFWVWIEAQLHELKQLKEGVEIPVKRGEDPTETFQQIDGAFEKAIGAVEILRRGDIPAFLATKSEVIPAVKLLREHIQGMHWGVDNLYNDLEERGTTAEGPVPPVEQWPQEMQEDLLLRIGTEEEQERIRHERREKREAELMEIANEVMAEK